MWTNEAVVLHKSLYDIRYLRSKKENVGSFFSLSVSSVSLYKFLIMDTDSDPGSLSPCTGSPVELKKNEKRFRVHKWSAVALWAYDITVDNCAICRNHIMDKCIECQSIQEMTNIDESCSIAWGKCSHVFHTHCISRWLNTRQVCPLDNRNWEFK